MYPIIDYFCIMKHLLILPILFLLAVGSLQAQKAIDSLHIAHYTLELDLRSYKTQTLHGKATLKAVPAHPLTVLTLELMQLQADSVTVNGKSKGFTHTNDSLRIPADGSRFAAGDTLEICVWYHGRPYSERFGGFYFSGEYAFNMGVCIEHIPHTAGKTWFPCVDAFTDKATYTYQIRTAPNHRAACGGRLADSTMLADSSIVWTWEQRKPIPTYLASVAAGPYLAYRDTFRSIDGRSIPIEINAHPSAIGKVPGSFARLKAITGLFETLFGPYPFGRIGYVTVPFSSGAMEHAGNIAYPLAAVDGTWKKEALYAHELSHAWFGDWVTCSGDSDMWLNEGFASWCEGLLAEYFSHTDSMPRQNPEAYRNWFRQQHRNVLANAHVSDGGYLPLSPMPQQHTYGSTTYNKGSLAVYSLRSYMGDSLFFKGLKSYIKEYGCGNATSRDLFRHLAQMRGLPMEDFMEAWVRQPGFLHFSVDSVTALGNGNYRTHLRQRLYHAERYGNHNHVTVSYFFPDSARKDVQAEFSGQYGTFECSLPQQPLFTVVDMADAFADAVIDTTLNINGKTNRLDFTDGNMMMMNVNGSNGFLRIEHNLLPADSLKRANSCIFNISGSHYWRILSTGAEAEGIIFSYMAQSEDDLDHALFKDYTRKNYQLLYRKDAADDWHIIPSKQTGTDGIGNLYTTFVQNGEYCFATGDTTGMGLNTSQGTIPVRIYPNPTSGELHIIIPEEIPAGKIRIYDSTGRLIKSQRIRNNALQIDVKGYSAGLYYIDIVDNKGTLSKKCSLMVK